MLKTLGIIFKGSTFDVYLFCQEKCPMNSLYEPSATVFQAVTLKILNLRNQELFSEDVPKILVELVVVFPINVNCLAGVILC